MALFGGGKRNAYYSTLMDTRSEEDRARELAGLMRPAASPGAAFNRKGFWAGSRSALPMQQAQPQLPDYVVGDRPVDPAGTASSTVQPGSVDPDVLKMVGQAPVRQKGGLRDVLASALAVLGDVAAQSSGQRGFAVNNLAKTWGDRRESYDDSLLNYQNRLRVAQLPGMSAREMAAYMADPKAWGGHMADTATSRYQAATLNPGDQRFLGDGNGVYQAPTRGQQYAGSLGLVPGTQEYADALRDQELGANGPTAFGNQQTLGDLGHQRALAMERMRQQGRMGMETMRQGNRMDLRGTPTYRDMNPPQRTGGGNGVAGSSSSPVDVSTPAQAQALKPGTYYRTPDGRVKIR